MNTALKSLHLPPRHNVRLAFLVVMLLLFFAAMMRSPAQIPKTIAYQGILTDAAGNPKPDGGYTVTFNIYNVPTGGTALWTQASVPVTTQRGIFSYILGSGTAFPATLDFSVQYYLGVTVAPDPEITPRVQLTAAPYAMRAATVDYGVPVGAIMPFAGTTAPAGWLLCNGAGYTAATYPELFAAIGTAYGNGGGAGFNVPDTRGRFLRGVDGGTGNDPDAAARTAMAAGGNTGNAVGSVQGHVFASHTHTQNPHTHTDAGHDHQQSNPKSFATNAYLTQGGTSFYAAVDFSDSRNGYAQPITQIGVAAIQNATATNQNTGGNETRPVNLYVNYIIKARP